MSFSGCNQPVDDHPIQIFKRELCHMSPAFVNILKAWLVRHVLTPSYIFITFFFLFQLLEGFESIKNKNKNKTKIKQNIENEEIKASEEGKKEESFELGDPPHHPLDGGQSMSGALFCMLISFP